MLIGVYKRFRESIYKCIMKELSKKKLILICEKPAQNNYRAFSHTILKQFLKYLYILLYTCLPGIKE